MTSPNVVDFEQARQRSEAEYEEIRAEQRRYLWQLEAERLAELEREVARRKRGLGIGDEHGNRGNGSADRDLADIEAQWERDDRQRARERSDVGSRLAPKPTP